MKALVRSVSVTTALAVALSMGAGTAGAATMSTASARGCNTTQAGVHSAAAESDHQALMAALDRASAAETPAEAAEILFPDDRVARAEVERRLENAETSLMSSTVGGQQAVPAALVPVLVVIGRCVVGALGGAGVNELITLVHQGKQATAEARVYAAVGGCITSVVPPFLRPLAERAKRPIAAAVLAIIIRWYS